eukprot:TRINITY_DN243_c0_g1_i8.p1 TRINITY_DN243_c0_g1~~TRINITY_DN243_c0_g1_i8.p1  ORF type:complete len:535 (+),score=79.01 TRINITY_DN243_c0_g1_i8:469-2073(+)
MDLDDVSYDEQNYLDDLQDSEESDFVDSMDLSIGADTPKDCAVLNSDSITFLEVLQELDDRIHKYCLVKFAKNNEKILSWSYRRWGGFIYQDMRKIAMIVNVNDGMHLAIFNCEEGSDQCKIIRKKVGDAYRNGKNTNFHFHKNTPLTLVGLSPHLIDTIKSERKIASSKYRRILRRYKKNLKLDESLEKNEHDVMSDLVREVLDSNPNYKNTFHYKLMLSQLLCVNKKSTNNFKWDPDIIQFCLTLSYFGGKKVYNLARGKAGVFKKKNGTNKYQINRSDWCLFLPSMNTLKKYIPPVNVYRSIDDCGDRIKETADSMRRNDQERVLIGGISGDEIEISPGLRYIESLHGVIGLSLGIVHEIDIDHIKYSDVLPGLAKKVMQFFFVSVEGDICVPFHYVPTGGLSGQDYFNLIDKMVDIFESNGISIVFGSTDGFTQSKVFLKLMKDKRPNYSHFFDYSHIIKNMRNRILTHKLVVLDPGFVPGGNIRTGEYNDFPTISFSLQQLKNDYETDKSWAKILNKLSLWVKDINCRW